MNVPECNLDVLVSPTTRCNLRCRYCYVDGSMAVPSSMTLDDADHAFRWLRDYARLIRPRRIRMTWFGGEPTLLGARFLEDALALQERHLAEFDVLSNIQTNLTLPVVEYVPIYHRYFRSTVGFSCDTPGGYRRFPDGADATDVVERHVKELQDRGVLLGAVCTLTARDRGRGGAIYEYFKNLGVRFRVNRAAASHRMSKEGLLLTISEYEDIVLQIAERYFSDPNPTISFHNMDLMVAAYLNGNAMLCVDPRNPQRYIGLEAAGRIMPRCRFGAAVGNYYTDEARDVLTRVTQMKFDYRRPQACRDCEFFGRVCLGACPGEQNCDCQSSDCGYRTEATCRIWRYVKECSILRGLEYGCFSRGNELGKSV